MNGYERAQALSLTGTPAQIVAVLNTLGAEDIPRLALNKFLREGEFLIYDGTAWYGSIQVLLNQNPSPIPAEHVMNIIALKSIVTGTGGDGLATTQPVWAAKIYSFVQLLATIAGDPGLIAVFYTMAGGRPYAGLTPEQYEAQAAAAQAEAAKASLRTRLQQERERFDARSNICLAGIADGTITSGAEILAVLELSGG